MVGKVVCVDERKEEPGRRAYPWLKSAVRRLVLTFTDHLVLDRHPLDDDLGRVQRLRRWARLGEAAWRGDHDALEAEHHRYWTGAGDEVWHARHEHRLDSWFVQEHGPFVDAIHALLADRPEIVRLVELGTGSGRVLEHLGRLLRDLDMLVGVDVAAGQMERNRARYPSDRLRFVCSDLVEYAESQAAPGTVYFTNGGVLEYVTQDRLHRLLEAVGEQRTSALALIEPIVEGMDGNRRSRVYGFERSFAHNYPALLEEHGFRIRHQREIEVGEWRFLEVVADRGSV